MAELELVHMGEYYTNPENTASYGGHNLLNLRMQYDVTDDFMVYVNVMDLADEEYLKGLILAAGLEIAISGEPIRHYRFYMEIQITLNIVAKIKPASAGFFKSEIANYRV